MSDERKSVPPEDFSESTSGGNPQALALAIRDGYCSPFVLRHLDDLLGWLGQPDSEGGRVLGRALVSVGLSHDEAVDRTYALLDAVILRAGPRNPEHILGLIGPYDSVTAKRRYRRFISAYHPDRHPEHVARLTPRLEQVNLAYRDLRQRIAKVVPDSMSETRFRDADHVDSGFRFRSRVCADPARSVPSAEHGYKPSDRHLGSYGLRFFVGDASLLQRRLTQAMVLGCIGFVLVLALERGPAESPSVANAIKADVMPISVMVSPSTSPLPTADLRPGVQDSARTVVAPRVEVAQTLPVVIADTPLPTQILQQIGQGATMEAVASSAMLAPVPPAVSIVAIETTEGNLRAVVDRGPKSTLTMVEFEESSITANVMQSTPPKVEKLGVNHSAMVKAVPQRVAPALSEPVVAEACSGVSTVLARFRQAYQSGAVDRLVNLYSIDAREKSALGRDMIRRLYANWFIGTSERDITFTSINKQPNPRGLCRVSANFNLSYRDGEGRHRAQSGVIDFLFKRSHGKTLIEEVRY